MIWRQQQPAAAAAIEIEEPHQGRDNARLAGRQRIDLDISRRGADCNARPER